jgi:hypothetical protein
LGGYEGARKSIRNSTHRGHLGRAGERGRRRFLRTVKGPHPQPTSFLSSGEGRNSECPAWLAVRPAHLSVSLMSHPGLRLQGEVCGTCTLLVSREMTSSLLRHIYFRCLSLGLQPCFFLVYNSISYTSLRTWLFLGCFILIPRPSRLGALQFIYRPLSL